MLWRLRGTAVNTPMWITPSISMGGRGTWSFDKSEARIFADDEKAKATADDRTEGCMALRGLTVWEPATGPQLSPRSEPKCNCEVCQRKIVSLSEAGRS